MRAEAAGAHRRTQSEREDQWLSWIRDDQAFFAAGACHLLAWACRASYPDRQIGIACLVRAGELRAFHTFAVWEDWTFDHAGWHPVPQLVDVNATFERQQLEVLEITSDLAGFCRVHRHRMPHAFWADPLPRARDYVSGFQPPWQRGSGVVDA